MVRFFYKKLHCNFSNNVKWLLQLTSNALRLTTHNSRLSTYDLRLSTHNSLLSPYASRLPSMLPHNSVKAYPSVLISKINLRCITIQEQLIIKLRKSLNDVPRIVPSFSL